MKTEVKTKRTATPKSPPIKGFGRLIENKIYEVRGQKVMLDFDLALLYEVETRVFNQAVKRNIDSFPEDFMFQLTAEEWEEMPSQMMIPYYQIEDNQKTNSSQFVISSDPNLKSQNVISSWGGRRKLPYAFTEHGVAMLASVLKSPTARRMSIAIVRAFIAMRKMILQYSEVIKVIDELKNRIDGHDVQLNQIYEALEKMLDKRTKEDEKENWKNRERIGFKK